MNIVFPDPLVWQSGLEFGIQALGLLRDEGLEFTATLLDHGPMLEAVALGCRDFQLSNRVRWVRKISGGEPNIDVAVFPRVCPMKAPANLDPVGFPGPILSSDPTTAQHSTRIWYFPRRDYRTLAVMLREVPHARVTAPERVHSWRAK
jgi:hypothetical protein